MYFVGAEENAMPKEVTIPSVDSFMDQIAEVMKENPTLEVVQEQATVNRGSFNAHSKLEFGYCTEFILDLKDPENFDESVLKSVLSIQKAKLRS